MHKGETQTHLPLHLLGGAALSSGVSPNWSHCVSHSPNLPAGISQINKNCVYNNSDRGSWEGKLTLKKTQTVLLLL